MCQHLIELQLSSTFEELERAVDTLQVFVSNLPDTEEELGHRIVLLASEALNNAMEHGNKWQPDKKASLRLAILETSVELEVTDEGPGVRLPKQDADPLLSANLLNDHGRGLLFMREYADEVHVADGASSIRLVFYR